MDVLLRSLYPCNCIPLEREHLPVIADLFLFEFHQGASDSRHSDNVDLQDVISIEQIVDLVTVKFRGISVWVTEVDLNVDTPGFEFVIDDVAELLEFRQGVIGVVDRNVAVKQGLERWVRGKREAQQDCEEDGQVQLDSHMMIR